jgi:hypothetical protein
LRILAKWSETDGPRRERAVPRAILTLIIFIAAIPAYASGTIFYGSRAGMEVTVISVEGLGTDRAVIRTKHTRENAVAFCRDYVQKVTEECVREELAKPLNDVITANCLTGEFTDFYANRYRFVGPNRKTRDMMAKYALMDLSTRQIADGSMASGYPTNMAIFKALCPAQAPYDE